MISKQNATIFKMFFSPDNSRQIEIYAITNTAVIEFIFIKKKTPRHRFFVLTKLEPYKYDTTCLIQFFYEVM